MRSHWIKARFPRGHSLSQIIYLFVWLYINNINHGILVISRVFMFSGGDHLQQMTVGTQNFVDHRLLACEHATPQVSASLGRHTWYSKWVHVPLSVSWRCLWQATDSKCFTTHFNDLSLSWIDLQSCLPSQQTLLEGADFHIKCGLLYRCCIIPKKKKSFKQFHFYISVLGNATGV